MDHHLVEIEFILNLFSAFNWVMRYTIVVNEVHYLVITTEIK